MRNKIDSLIAEATKNKEKTKLEVLRASKSGYDTKILIKMVDQRKESIRQYIAAGRNNLVEIKITFQLNQQRKRLWSKSDKVGGKTTDDEIYSRKNC